MRGSKRLLFPKTDGYLQVTNKRIIYATSTQLGGSNLLVSELPLMDVGPISSFIGKSIKIWALLLFVGAAFMIAGFLAEKLPEFMTHWAFALVLMLPWFVFWLLESNILNQELKDRIINNFGSDQITEISKVEMNQTLKIVFMVLLYWYLLLGAAFIKVISSAVSGSLAWQSGNFVHLYVPEIFGFQDDYVLEIASKPVLGMASPSAPPHFSLFLPKASLPYQVLSCHQKKRQ